MGLVIIGCGVAQASADRREAADSAESWRPGSIAWAVRQRQPGRSAWWDCSRSTRVVDPPVVIEVFQQRMRTALTAGPAPGRLPAGGCSLAVAALSQES